MDQSQFEYASDTWGYKLERWTQVPKDLFKDLKSLGCKPTDSIVVLALVSSPRLKGTNQAHVSYKHLRDMTGLTKAAIGRALTHAAQLGLIDKTPGDHPRAANGYDLTKLLKRLGDLRVQPMLSKENIELRGHFDKIWDDFPHHKLGIMDEQTLKEKAFAEYSKLAAQYDYEDIDFAIWRYGRAVTKGIVVNTGVLYKFLSTGEWLNMVKGIVK